ncbi:MAG TPA: hypothetical protein DF613_17505 [Lachnospiraceae bacterium]|nr:hypothetical protein [Lachnospiraceae bacterium]
MKKKIICSFLVIYMLFSLIPFSIYAKEAGTGAEGNPEQTEKSFAGKSSNKSGFLAPIDDPDSSAVRIETAEDLAAIKNNLYGSYVLMNDIDLSEYGEWTPIGVTSATAFHGKLDGQGHKITGMKVSVSFTSATLKTPSYVAGLFGVCDGAEIKNIFFENSDVSIKTTSGYRYDAGAITSEYSVYAGTVAGYVKNRTVIYNCCSSGNVKADASGEGYSATIAGGLLGCAETAIISYSYNQGNIQGYNKNSVQAYNTMAGGLIGQVTKECIIDKSYNEGTVAGETSDYGESYAGGVVAYTKNAKMTVTDCFNEGTVQSLTGNMLNCDVAYAGGISAYFSGTIDRVYNAGSVTAQAKDPYGINNTSAYAGGICGYSQAPAQINHSAIVQSKVSAAAPGTKYQYRISYLGEKNNNVTINSVASGSTNDASMIKTLEDMKERGIYETTLGWDFDKIWEMDEGKDFPRLRQLQVESEIYNEEYITQHLNFIDGTEYANILADYRWAQIYWSEENNFKSNLSGALYTAIDNVIDLATLNFGDLFADNDPFKVILADYISDQTVRTEVVNLYKVTVPYSLDKTYEKVEAHIRKHWDKDAYGELSDEDLFWLFHYKDKGSEQWINENFEKHISEIVYDEKTENLEKALGITSEIFHAILEQKKHLDNTIDWLNGLINYAGEVEAYVSVNDDFKLVLAEMCNHLSDSSDTDKRYQSQLRAALESYVQYNDASNLRATMFQNYLKDTAVNAVENFIFDNMKKQAEKWLESVLSEKAFSAYQAIVKAADTTWKVMEYVTKNGELQECREMLKANAYFEKTMYATLRSIEKRLKEEKTFKEAGLFDTAFKFFKETEICSMDTVMQYLETYQTSWVAAIRNRSNTFARSAIEEVLINKLFIYRMYCHGQSYKLGGKIVTVACPTDLSIYDKDGNLVVSVKNNKVTECAEGVYAYTADCVKIAALPDDQEYSIKIDATNDGLMDYSVSEYTSDMQNVRKIEYTNVPISKGELYTGTIESGIGIKADAYDLVDKAKEPIAENQVVDENTYVPLETVSINANMDKMNIGDTAELKLSVTPKNTTEQTFVWSSSDDKILSVDEKGVVRALFAGNATITVCSLSGGISNSIEIVCEDIAHVSEKIKRITDSMGKYETATAKSSDREPIDRLCCEINELLAEPNLANHIRNDLMSAWDKAQILISKINEVTAAINTDNIKAATGIHKDNVQIANKLALQKAKADYEKALKDHPGNYTDTEKEHINGRIKELNDALKAIENAEKVIDMIKALPDSDKITVSDANSIRQAVTAYNDLSGHEQEIVDAQTKSKLEVSVNTIKNIIAAKIKQTADKLDNFEITNVKLSDQEVIVRSKEEIEAILAITILTDEDITILNGLKVKCDNLLARISGVAELIGQLLSTIDSYDEKTVKSTDQEALKQLAADIDLLTGTGNLTADDISKLAESKSKVLLLINVLKEIAGSTDTVQIKAAEGITKDNVRLEDKEILKNAKNNLEEVLEKNRSNYTTAEVETLQSKIRQIENALEIIENVEKAMGLINALPSADKITAADTDSVKAAKAAYDALTEYAKTLVYTDTKAKLDASVEALKTKDKEQAIEKNPVAATVKVSKIRLAGISKKIAAGKKIKLTANVAPSNASNKAVTWTSSNKKVATVNSAGVVTLKKKTGGKSVTITATARDGSGVKATYKIKSMKGVVKKIVISGKKSEKAGNSLKLKAKVTATKNANKKLKWMSSNKKYATVSNSGKVKTLKAGKGKSVKITAMAIDGSGKKKSVTIKIK